MPFALDANIQVVQNLSNDQLRDDESRFVEELAALLTPWGLPLTAARLYGYLQIRSDPVSLDQIAEGLSVSKSNACTAARLLEQHGNARRRRERGTKRILYIAGEDPAAPLRQQIELLGKMSRLISDRQRGSTDIVDVRLRRLAAFHSTLQRAIAEATRD